MFSKSYKSQTVEALRGQISGSVVVRGDAEYEEQRRPWSEIVEQKPAFIINAASTQDIVEAVQVAQDLQLPLGVQNTGHGIAVPCNGGILLRLNGLKSIELDLENQTATIGPGVTSGELLQAAEHHGLVFSTGQVPSVGMSGYTLGGGHGWLSRTMGPACSKLLSAAVVLADGSVVTASAQEHPDLFWAIRGGGGNFGVIASMTLRLSPLTEIFGGAVYYRMEDARDVLEFYRRWSATLPLSTNTALRIMRVPPKPNFLLHLHGLKTCMIAICHTDRSSAEALHAEILNFKKPAIDELRFRPLSEMADLDEASSQTHATTFVHVESLADLTSEVSETLLQISEDFMPPLVLLQLQHLGGAYSETHSDMSFTAPTAPYFLSMISPTLDTELQDLALLTKEAFRKLGTVFTNQLTFNWMRADQQPRLISAFGREKYQRLQAVKSKYDPANLFHLNLNVPPLA